MVGTDDVQQEEGPGIVATGRKAVAATTLSLFLATAGVTGEAAAGQHNHGPKPKQPPVTQVDPQTAADDAAFEREVREINARDALIAEAKRNYGRIASQAETGYSRELDDMQKRLTAYLQQSDPSIHNRVVILDPRKFDTGMALGMQPSNTIRNLLAGQNVHADPEVVDGAASKMTGSLFMKYGVNTYTQDPTAFLNARNPNPEACVIVPSSESALAVDIKGLPHAKTLEFTNRHESWHCLDTKYNTRHLDPKELEKFGNTTDLKEKIKNKAGLEALSIEYKKEAFADVGAAGDMIRNGEGLDIIDRVAAFRAGRPGDVTHLSTPVLEGLKETIQRVGVDNFRKMSPQQAKNLYFEVTDKYGPTARSMEVAFKFDMGNPLQRFGYILESGDPEVAKGMDLARRANMTPAGAGETPGEAALSGQVADYVAKWDASQLLKDRAFVIGKKITPDTLTQAYGQMRSELYEQQKQHPDNPYYIGMAAKLQQVYVNDVKSLNYLELNEQYGRKLERTEPALRGTRAPVPKPSG